MNALSIPPAAARDPKSVEMFRAWIAEGGLHCSLKVGMYAKDGPEAETVAWGVILADAAQHVADALQAHGAGRRDDLLRAIVKSFADEMQAPTSGRSGEFA